MANQDASQEIVLNAFEAPEHGWRGLGVEGNRKRKWYTVLDNEFVLVTALVVCRVSEAFAIPTRQAS